MINVLIVDDDNLVRKGLISILPWEEYGMRVVGEAKNGEKALEYIASHPVDLLLTDLAMPVMSGMELMRVVRKQYPHIFVVVLTLHQDFEYIQECLRLGAIDYIAKVEMEKDNFSEVMRRIKGRIHEEQRKVSAPRPEEVWENRSNFGYALIGAPNVVQGENIDRDEIWANLPHVELDSEISICLPKDAQENAKFETELMQRVERQSNWIVVKMDGLQGFSKREIHDFIREYMDFIFFYDVPPYPQMIDVSMGKNDAQAVTEDMLSDLKKRGQALDWIHQSSEFTGLLEDLKAAQLQPAKLMSFLHSLWTVWNRIYGSVTDKHIDIPHNFNHWDEVNNWLHEVRAQLIDAIGKAKYSEEVKDCIAKAVKAMHEELSGTVHASEMAKRVNMSRSYFSQCFRDLVGMTFNEYLRHIRMEKAKEYLRLTQKSIQWISENTGYTDQKYFSRVFQEKTGMLPSEYRQSR